jgi:predicted kinase
VLISLSGLPGTGKSTVARLAASELGAVYLRIDSTEAPMLRAGFAVEGVGYEAAQAVASDNLALGRTVVADCVNPWPLTRDAWRTVGQRVGVRVVEIEFVCSNGVEHRRRVEARHREDPRWPSWQSVLDRDYRPWQRERLVIDTAHAAVDRAVALMVSAARQQPAG